METLTFNDFGLGNFRKEGFAFIDILRSAKLRITLLILLPGQTLPQHLHPPYDNETGKEETLRVIYGHTRVYVAGSDKNEGVKVPAGKEAYYTVFEEVGLEPGGQYSIKPGIEHWLQGGQDGSVNICFQNRVDEAKNVFLDSDSTGCQIKPR
ncbi:MAG: hypothetical protein KAT56_07815 [Sedimentisphaerales bacterium]|nr:hypothetical protein [Sedimentisphaerales bacterium]